VFGPAIYIQFVHRFLGITQRRGREVGAYLLGLLFMGLVFSDQFITGFHYGTFGRIANGGWAYRAFTCFAAVTVIYCLYVLYRSLRGRSNEEQNRIKYIMCGMGLGSILLACDIIPTWGYDVYPLGSMSFVSAIIIAIGVMKYDLLDIGLIFRRALTYTTLTVTLAGVYVAIASVFNLLLMNDAWWSSSHLQPVLSALVMVLVFDPVKSLIQGWVDRLFHRNRIDYDKVMPQLSERLASFRRVSEIAPYITDSMLKLLSVERCLLFLGNGHEYRAEPVDDEGIIPGEHPLPKALKTRTIPLHDHQLVRLPASMGEKEGIKSLFQAYQAVLAVPLIAHQDLIGFFLLGQKLSGEVFFREEMRFLMTVANQTAISLENARVWGELKAINETLERRVEERTHALRQALEEKERAQKQLIQKESLAAIGQLVAGTAHELNNPLAAALSLLQTSLEELEDRAEESDEELIDDLNFVRKELQRAAGIVKSLLDISRQTEQYTEEVRIHEVIEDALRVLHNMAKKLAVEIKCDFHPRLPVIRGNFAQLGQVWINIIKNALQAFPEGKGEIVLTTDYDKERNVITMTCADSGIGIPDEIKHEVFNPFFTTKEVGMGTGLGLYISHELVRRHGGTITLSDRPGGGTVVAIDIPVAR